MNKTSIKVSVSVTTYNHVKYIENCLDNILSQETDFDFEILLGEDESNDGTREICQRYQKEYPEKIKLFLNSRKDVLYINGSPTGRINLLNNLKNAKGKYIAICDGDDSWLSKNKLQKQVEFLEKNQNYSICYHDVDLIKTDKDLKSYWNPEHKDTTTIVDLANASFIYPSSCMFRNNLPQKIPDLFYKVSNGDYPLFMMLAESGKIKYLDEKMSTYNIHSGGVWSSISDAERYSRLINTLDYLIEYFQLNNDVKQALIKQKMRNVLWIAGLDETIKVTLKTEKQEMLAEFYGVEISSYLCEKNDNFYEVIGQLNRIVRHPVIKVAVKILAFFKRDKSFGTINDNVKQ